MDNLVLLGFGDKVEEQVACKIKINKLLAGIRECWITTFNPLGCEINSRQVGTNEDTPYIMFVYEPRDVKSGQIEEIIKRLEEGGIKMLIEYHPIPLAQATPNLKELKEAIATGVI